jgi:hypothetical protein
MRRNYCLGIAIVAVCSAMLGGCGSGGRAPLAKTTGVVKFDGQPVEGVKVTFLPKESTAMFSHGTTDKEGKFTMSTYGLNDGAIVGKHNVIVSKVEVSEENKLDPAEMSKTGYGGAGYQNMMGPGKKKEAKNELPKKYTDAKTSGIEVTVELGQNNEVPINLVK